MATRRAPIAAAQTLVCVRAASAKAVEHEIEAYAHVLGKVASSSAAARWSEGGELEVLQEACDELDFEVWTKELLADAYPQDFDDIGPPDRLELVETIGPIGKRAGGLTEEEIEHERVLLDIDHGRRKQLAQEIISLDARIDDARAFRLPRAHFTMQDLIEEIFLGLRREIHRSLADTGLARDVVDRGLLEAEARKCASGLEEDAIFLGGVQRVTRIVFQSALSRPT
jgi:hypothetical protein